MLVLLCLLAQPDRTPRGGPKKKVSGRRRGNPPWGARGHWPLVSLVPGGGISTKEMTQPLLGQPLP